MSMSPPAGRPKVPSLLLVALLCATSLVAMPAAAATTGPVVNTANFVDVDGNGHADGVQLTWDQPIRDSTVRPTDFSIRVGGITNKGTGFSTAGAGDGITGTANDAKMTITFPEFLNYDGAGATISYTGPSADTNPEGVKDTGGEAPPSSGDVFAMATIDDAIAPYMKGLYARVSDMRIYAVFTEAVGTGSGATTAPGPSNFCMSGFSPALTISSVDGTAPSRVWVLNLGRELTSDDLTNGRITPCGGIQDTSATPIAATVPDMDPYTAGPQPLLIGAPTLLRIHGGRGDANIVAEFSGPVATATGTPFTDASMFSLTTGGTGLTGVTLGQSFAGSDRVLLTASGAAPIASDFGTACFKVNYGVSGVVFGWKSGSSVFPVPAGTGCGASDPNSRTLTDAATGAITAPRIIKVETVDANSDGKLDGLDVTFNENIDDSSVTKDGWAVHFPRTTNPSPGIPEQSVLVDSIATTTANDNVIRLVFTPPTNSGTGVLPRVSYADSRLSGFSYVAGSYVLPPVGTRLKDQAGIELSRAFCAAPCASPGVYTPFMIQAVDNARPILVSATTIDTDNPANGNTNGYLLVFSENIVDSTFDHTRWTAKVRTSDSDPGLTIPITGKETVTANDNQMRIVWDERGYDTGDVPDLTYTGGPDAIQFVTDNVGLRLQDIVAGALSDRVPADPACPAGGPSPAPAVNPVTKTLCELDGVGPFLIEVRVTVGAKEARAKFSETLGGTSSGDFAYRARNSVGAASITNAVTEGTSPAFVALTFNNNLDAADISGSPNDCIQLQASLKDVAGNQGFPPFNTAVGSPCRLFALADAPRLSEDMPPETIDSNHDGYLDAVKLTFTKPIDDFGSNLPNAALGFRYRFGEAANKTASAVVTGSTAGSSFVLSATGPYPSKFCFVDSNADNVFSTGEALYLQSACGAIAAGTVRFANPPTGTRGSQVTGTSPDFGQTTKILAGAFGGLDMNGNAVFDLGDILFVDLDLDGIASVGDLFLTDDGGIDAGTFVTAGYTHLGDVYGVGVSGVFQYLDSDVSGGYTLGDILLLDDPSGDGAGVGYQSSGDILWSGASFGSFVTPTGTCPVSGDLLPNVANDNILFICFGDVERAGGTPVPNTGATPRVSFTRPSSSTMRAFDGQPVGAFVLAQTVDAAQPVLVKAEGNPGSSVALLTFSEPVVGHGGRPLIPADFIYANGNVGTGPCPSTASNVQELPPATGPGVTSGPMTVTVGLNGPLSNADLGVILGCNFDSIRPNPSGIEEPTAAGGKPAFLPAVPQVRFQDTLPPTLLKAGFLDGNGDGIIDAVRLQFSEFVQDSKFYTHSPDTGMNSWNVKFASTFLKVTRISTGYDGTDVGNAEACLTDWPTISVAKTRPDDLVAPPVPQANDNYLFLCLDTSVPASAGGTKDLGTGIEGQLGYTPPSEAARGVDLASNRLANIADQPILDQARPVVLNRGGTNPVFAQTADRDRDGKIDAMRLTLSEPVKDDGFKTGEWTLTGRTVKDFDTVGVIGAVPGTAADDSQIWIAFDEANAPDTGLGSTGYPAAPDIVYSGGGSVRDLKGNALRGIAGGACATTSLGCAHEIDGAGPVVVIAEARSGTNFATLTFSEKVGFGPAPPGLPCGRPIRGTDLQYLAGNTGGAGGITAVAHDFLGGCGAERISIGFDHNLTADDLAKDRIGFITGGQTESIREAGGPGYLPLVNTYSWLDHVVDGTPPASIRDLAGKSTGGTSVELSWTAPTATDLASYEVRYCACTMTATNFAAGTRATTGVPTPSSGTKQTMPLTGLTSGTAYNVAIITIDADGNRADISNVLAITPAPADTVKPSSLGGLTFEGSSGTQVTLKWTAGGEDGATGTVTSYQFAAGVGLTEDTYEDALITTFTLNPAPPAAPDATQRATLSGLPAGQTLVFAVRACDDASPPNCGPWAAVPGKVGSDGPLDTVRPSKINDLDADAGIPPSSAINLTWHAPADDLDLVPSGKVAGYTIKVSTSPITGSNPGTDATVTFLPASLATPGQKQNATLTGLAGNTTYYISVIARDEVGPASVAAIVSLTTALNPNAVTTDQLQRANEAVNDCLEAHPVDAGVELTFCIPTVDDKQALGIQLWRLDPESGDWKLIKTIRQSDPEYQTGNWTDPNGGEDDQYKATAFFDETSSQGFVNNGSPDAIPGFADLSATLATNKLPIWVWIALGAAVLLILLLVLLLILKRGRGPKPAEELAPAPVEETPAEPAAEAPAEDAWKEAEAQPAAPVPTAGEQAWTEAAVAPAAAPGAKPLPPPSATTHYVTCPSCATDFRATGVKPLAIQCPSCGIRGALR